MFSVVIVDKISDIVILCMREALLERIISQLECCCGIVGLRSTTKLNLLWSGYVGGAFE